MGAGFPAFGADALRFTLASYSPQAKRIALAPKRIEGYRHFCNKIWNATRFALTYLEREGAPAALADSQVSGRSGAPPADGALPKTTWRANRWIMSRLSAALAETSRGLSDFRLDDASGALYRFFWNELCDWYLEITKPVLQDEASPLANEVVETLGHVLETSLRALHPFVPFLTEELWHRVPRPASRPASIALAPFPEASEGKPDPEADREMAIVAAVIVAARTIRSEHEVHPGAEVPLALRSNDPAIRELLASELRTIRTLVKSDGEPVIEPSGGGRPPGTVMSVAGEVEVLVGLRGLVDPAKEEARVERDIKKIDKDVANLEKKLASPAFVEKAPPDVVTESRSQLDALRRARARLDEAIELARELKKPKS
jgi:valyl-tRNA synthetase